MRHEHWLRAAEMRIRRHQRGRGALGLIGARSHQRHEILLQQRDSSSQIQSQVERHLLVARAAGMKSTTGVANPFDETTLDKAVDVLVRTCDRLRVAPALLEDHLQRADDRFAVFPAEHPRGFQRVRPRDAAGDVVLKEQTVEAERDAEVEGGRIGCSVEAAGPERHAWISELVRLKPDTTEPACSLSVTGPAPADARYAPC